ncbi:hypothetical protein CDL12_21787 [Handroanthus impetiginosus]|uniref:Uncharacterized protein n=1 Tax=Handroanthus impetiginosus TaxID=429701 RepID=A0A2G9GKC5_9LAMI|nr:hypothetical protein CDL12_21787 [Handroanthus impetiginosus]
MLLLSFSTSNSISDSESLSSIAVHHQRNNLHIHLVILSDRLKYYLEFISQVPTAFRILLSAPFCILHPFNLCLHHRFPFSDSSSNAMERFSLINPICLDSANMRRPISAFCLQAHYMDFGFFGYLGFFCF